MPKNTTLVLNQSQVKKIIPLSAMKKVIARVEKAFLSYTRGKEELDPAILKKGKVVIDDWAQASHSGEINAPLRKGIIKKKDIYASLGEIVSGRRRGRVNDKEITVFDSTGLAIQDLFVAELVYQLTKKKKLGKKIDLIH